MGKRLAKPVALATLSLLLTVGSLFIGATVAAKATASAPLIVTTAPASVQVTAYNVPVITMVPAVAATQTVPPASQPDTAKGDGLQQNRGVSHNQINDSRLDTTTEGIQPDTVVSGIASVPLWAWVASGLFVSAAITAFVWRRRAVKTETATCSPGGSEAILTTQNDTSASDTPLIGNLSHIGSRDSQQDSFGISTVDGASGTGRSILAIVADGMGGLQNGQEISRLAVKTMLAAHKTRPTDDDGAAMLSTLLRITVAAVGERFHNDRKTGTTLASVLISQQGVYWLAVGDSLICLCRGGELTALNVRHTTGAEADTQAAMGVISYQQAAAREMRHAVTSFLGMGEIKRVDRNVKPLLPMHGDRLILMSDGVFDTVGKAELCQLLEQDAPLAAEAIQRAVLAKQDAQQDNFTAIILQF